MNNRTGPTFALPDGTLTATGASIQIIADPAFGQIYRVTRANLNTARNTTQLYTSFFVQDQWTISQTTLNLNLYWQVFSGKNGLGIVDVAGPDRLNNGRPAVTTFNR